MVHYAVPDTEQSKEEKETKIKKPRHIVGP